LKYKADSTPRRHSPGRKVLGLFAAVWLNLALQPCTMAMEAGQDCPHCPPQHEQHMAGHHGHDTGKIKAPCDSLDADCGDPDNVSLDARGGQLKLKYVADMPVAIPTALQAFDPVTARAAVPHTGPPGWSTRTTPLHVLHCVYLK